MKKQAYWVLGNYFDCNEAVKSICDKCPGYDIIIVDGTSDSINTAVLNLAGNDIFGSKKKIIRIKALPNDFEALCDYIELVNKDRVLIIDAQLEFTRNRRKVDASKSKLYDKVSKVGRILKFPIVVHKDVALSRINEFAEKNKKSIDADAADLLIESKNCNLDYIFSEISKIIYYVGSRRKIVLDDVTQCIQKDYEFFIWAFIDSVTTSDEQKSLNDLSVLMNTDEFSETLPFIVSLLISRFEMLFFARSFGKTVDLNALKGVLSELKKEVKLKEEDKEEYSMSNEMYRISPSSTRRINTIRKYTDGAIYAFSNSNAVGSAIGSLGTIRIAQILSVLYFSASFVRKEQNEARKKSMAINMVRSVCGSTSVDNFKEAYADVYNN